MKTIWVHNFEQPGLQNVILSQNANRTPVKMNQESCLKLNWSTR